MYKSLVAIALAVHTEACGPKYLPYNCLAEAVKDEHVVLYDEQNYEGDWYFVDGDRVGDSTYGPPNWEKRVQSIKIGTGVRALFCDQADCNDDTPDEHMFEMIGPDERAELGSWGSKITHVKVETLYDGEVTLYDGEDCGGNHVTFDKGDYPFRKFIAKIKNDRTKGIKVPAGMTATLYKHGNYSGWAKEFVGPAVFCDLNAVEGAQSNHASALRVRGTAKDSIEVLVDLSTSELI